MFWAFLNSLANPSAKAESKPSGKPGINSPALASPSVPAAPVTHTQDRDLSGLKRRALVKSPAKKTAKPAASAAKQRAKATPAPSVAKKPVKAAPKSIAKKPVVKAPVKKVAVKKTVAKKTVIKKPAPAVKAPVKKAVSKPSPAKPVVKTPVKPASKAVAKPAAPARKPAPLSKAPAVPAPPVVAPTKPVGKRAAKKAMMEQMTQAEVVPTHAPDAAKATFSQIPERLMTPLPVHSPAKKDAKRANNWKTTPVEQLADADVMAMPDSEYMNDVQQVFFRRKLLQLRADMLANAGETTEHLREDTSVMPDPADRATIEEEHALELRTRDRERKLLKKIEQAITRIDAGDYGYCDETGEPIGVGRLMARPTANLSLEAQQRRELKQKMFGD